MCLVGRSLLLRVNLLLFMCIPLYTTASTLSSSANLQIAQIHSLVPTTENFSRVETSLAKSEITVNSTPVTSPYTSQSNRATSKLLEIMMFNTKQIVKLAIYYFLLYFFTIVYNVTNKKVLDVVPLPASVATVQMILGIPMFLPVWMMKPPKHLKSINLKSYSTIALCHGLGNLATVYALQAGSVSFTHVVKSAEPIFSAVLAVLFMNSRLSTLAYISLLPIVVGVALASLKEFHFSWLAFIAAMLSNFFYQARMVLSKVLLASEGESPSAANTFRILTILASLQMIPIAALLERNRFMQYLNILASSRSEGRFSFINLMISSASFYIYNEVAFWILDLVHPVTHAVGNTIKRVVLILASIVILRTPVSGMGMIGSAIAVIGSFLYALAQHQGQGANSGASCNINAVAVKNVTSSSKLAEQQA